MPGIDLINQIRWDVRKSIAMTWRYDEFHILLRGLLRGRLRGLLRGRLSGRLAGPVMFSIQQAIDQEARHNVWTTMHRGR